MKKKFNLNELKVKSFVTNLDKELENTINGGMPPCETLDGTADGCHTNKVHCPLASHPMICP